MHIYCTADKYGLLHRAPYVGQQSLTWSRRTAEEDEALARQTAAQVYAHMESLEWRLQALARLDKRDEHESATAKELARLRAIATQGGLVI
jgi:hypothetical protein